MWFIIACLIAPVVLGVMWEVWQAWESVMQQLVYSIQRRQ